MARLPGGRFLMQQIGGNVVLFEDMTEREVLRFDPSDMDAVATAQKAIYDSKDLTGEEKAFAHLWSGYFYAYGPKLAAVSKLEDMAKGADELAQGSPYAAPRAAYEGEARAYRHAVEMLRLGFPGLT